MKQTACGTLAYFAEQIGTYDKQLWERSVEKKVIKSIHSVPKKTVKNKPELIDVDLVRGSTFPKAKPRHGWISVTRRGLLRIIFFPFYYRWWQEQTNGLCTTVLFLLYFMQLVTLVIFWRDADERLSPEVISVCHVIVPVVMMILLGLIHAHIVATQESYRPHRKAKVRSKSDRPKGRKTKNKSTSSASGQSEHETKTCNTAGPTCADSSGCIRQRKFSSKATLNRRRSGSTISSGALLSDKNLMDKSDEADDETDDDIHYRKMKETLNATQSGSGRLLHPKISTINNSVKGSDSELKNEFVLSGREIWKSSQTCDNKLSHDIYLNSHSSITASQVRSDVNERLSDEIAPCSLDECELVDGFTEVTGEIIQESGIKEKNSKYPSLVTGVESLCSNDLIGETDKDSGVTTKNDTDSNSETSHILEAAPYQVSGSQAYQWGTILQHVNNLSDSISTNVNDMKENNHIGEEHPGKMSPAKAVEVDAKSVSCTLRKPSSLNLRCTQLKEECIGVSSCDSEGDATTPQTPKLLSSEMEWEGNSDMTSCGDTSSNTASDSELSDDNLTANNSDKDNNTVPHISSVINNLASGSDKVSCMIWEGEEVKKIDLTVLDIGWTIIRKVDKIPETCDYLMLGLVFTLLVAAMPCAFRIYQSMDKLEPVEPLAITPEHLQKAKKLVFGQYWSETVLVINGMIQRCIMGFIFFFLLSVAERTFKQRLLYAKHFCYLTSSRRAKKYDMPHFRLNKVRNIKTWFSLRSYLKKRGPQRSVDSIVSAAFVLEVILISVMCFQLLQGSETFLEHLGNWELVMWCMALAIYLLRFMTLGTKINKKYRNFSVLITEQINLYLQMEQKPHKKDELMMANSVLKLAEALLKELEIPFKISGLSANPFLYNITKVILLSAFSAVLTELFGFKLKLYKIKLRA